MYSTDRISWLPIKNRYLEEWHFAANVGPADTRHQLLSPRVRARHLRIIPYRGKNDMCFIVEVYGCSKEPWIKAKKEVIEKAKRIGFDMWHVVVSKWNRGKTLEIKCFPNKAKFDGVQNIYEVHGIYDIPLKTNNGLVTLGKIKETTIYKCVARDTKERVVSTQLYIVTITGVPFLMPVQEQGLLHQGGMPVLNPFGTIWAYEPGTAKITFLHFMDKTYSYEFYGYFNEYSWPYFYLNDLGPANTKEKCFQLALLANQRYFVFPEDRRGCFSSWALPFVAEPIESLNYQSLINSSRTVMYIVQQTRKPYEVQWVKGDKAIGIYSVDSEETKDSPIFKYLPHGVGKYRFTHDSYSTTHGYDSHSLLIKDFRASDATDFTIKIFSKRRKSIHWGKFFKPNFLYSRSISLRHFSEPRIDLSKTGGACLNHNLTITAKPIRGEYIEAEEWEVEWRKIVNGTALKTNMETDDPFILRTDRATSNHSGVYRIRVKNRYGFAEGLINVHVVERLPSILSVTSSPHVVVEDSSDILQIDVENAHELSTINWYHNDKLISFEDRHYTFPGMTSYNQHKQMIKKYCVCDISQKKNSRTVLSGKTRNTSITKIHNPVAIY
ncbi:uncharacterized protein LOC124452511 [Xenia sp. Carnegie-2017]|uniref:uncharacterized protein LOC124452511 n=1 Tax=Xenia sp. Carnegie-2017 TaxID=2897299 RepID=UPI001F04DB6B|nr:uncharacterized protein LOC124452511 [Xenia sp. Carnegie-2017]